MSRSHLQRYTFTVRSEPLVTSVESKAGGFEFQLHQFACGCGF